jgi:hypothetical protein
MWQVKQVEPSQDVQTHRDAGTKTEQEERTHRIAQMALQKGMLCQSKAAV